MLFDLAVEVDITIVPPESAFLCEGNKHHAIVRQPRSSSFQEWVYPGHEKAERNNVIGSQ